MLFIIVYVNLTVIVTSCILIDLVADTESCFFVALIPLAVLDDLLPLKFISFTIVAKCSTT